METLFQTIKELYGLELHSSEKVTKGFLSENHVLFSADKKFFLKKYRFDKEGRIKEVHAAKHYFAQHGIPVILPLSTQENNTYFFFENGYFALFPFVEGKQFERGDFSEKSITSLGAMLANIHLAGKSAEVVNNDAFSVPALEKSLEKIEVILGVINSKEVLDQFDLDALRSIELKKQLLVKNSATDKDALLPNDHLIHGDYLDQNVFFNDQDEVSFVFDFEKTNYSPRTYELFRSMMYSFLDLTNLELSSAQMKVYFDAYIRVYPMSDDEVMKGLKLFQLKAQHDFWVESEHYLKNSTRVDQFLNNAYYRVKYLDEEFDTLLNKLLS